MTTGLNEQTAVLRQRLDEATRRGESLRQLIDSISGELALEPLLTRIVESAVQLIGAHQGTIGLVVERAGVPIVRTAAAYNMPPQELGAEMPRARICWRSCTATRAAPRQPTGRSAASWWAMFPSPPPCLPSSLPRRAEYLSRPRDLF
jgi:hypothetical protein